MKPPTAAELALLSAAELDSYFEMHARIYGYSKFNWYIRVGAKMVRARDKAGLWIKFIGAVKGRERVNDQHSV